MEWSRVVTLKLFDMSVQTNQWVFRVGVYHLSMGRGRGGGDNHVGILSCFLLKVEYITIIWQILVL